MRIEFWTTTNGKAKRLCSRDWPAPPLPDSSVDLQLDDGDTFRGIVKTVGYFEGNEVPGVMANVELEPQPG